MYCLGGGKGAAVAGLGVLIPERGGGGGGDLARVTGQGEATSSTMLPNGEEDCEAWQSLLI